MKEPSRARRLAGRRPSIIFVAAPDSSASFLNPLAAGAVRPYAPIACHRGAGRQDSRDSAEAWASPGDAMQMLCNGHEIDAPPRDRHCGVAGGHTGADRSGHRPANRRAAPVHRASRSVARAEAGKLHGGDRGRLGNATRSRDRLLYPWRRLSEQARLRPRHRRLRQGRRARSKIRQRVQQQRQCLSRQEPKRSRHRGLRPGHRVTARSRRHICQPGPRLPEQGPERPRSRGL